MGRRTHPEYSALQGAAIALSHPPLKREGRIAEGDPRWGDGRVADDGNATYAEGLSPPPGPLSRADLPPAAGGDDRPRTISDGATLEEKNHSIFAANRAHGRIAVTLAATSLGPRRVTTREDGSLRVRFPGACAGPPEAILVNTAGGIAGGDRFAIDLALHADAQLVVTTAAAEKVYRSLGPDACLDMSATLADGAELTWLPQETILFDRARLARTITIALAPGAKLLLAETVVFGRAAMGETVHEGSFTDRWRVRRDGRLIFADNWRLEGCIADRLDEVAVARGCAALGTVLMVPGDDALIAAARAASGQFRGEAGVSAWNGIALARLAAPDGAALRHDLVLLLSAFGHRALPRIWLN
jgi:urease accessory protein